MNSKSCWVYPSDQSAVCLLCTELIAERSNIADSTSLFADGIMMGVMVPQIGSTTSAFFFWILNLNDNLVWYDVQVLPKTTLGTIKKNLARTSFSRRSETDELEVVFGCAPANNINSWHCKCFIPWASEWCVFWVRGTQEHKRNDAC